MSTDFALLTDGPDGGRTVKVSYSLGRANPWLNVITILILFSAIFSLYTRPYELSYRDNRLRVKCFCHPRGGASARDLLLLLQKEKEKK